MYHQIDSNKRKTVVLILGFIIFVSLFGWVLARALGNPGLFLVLAIGSVIYALVSYHFSAALTLALSGAKPLERSEAPEVYRVVENLSIAGGLPMPKIYIVDDPAPNAFATGKDPAHASVAVTSGLLEIMDKSELEGVLAHELSHVGNYDIRLMAVVLVLVSVISLLSHLFLRMTFFGGRDRDEGGGQLQLIFLAIGIMAAILAPIVATVVQLAVSRKREYLADASGALLTRYPEGLASALEKIARVNKPVEHASPATAHMYFANPLGGRGIGASISNLFSTHPPIEDRIARLKNMEDQS